MPPAPSEITRDDLLAFLKREGFRVSSHQLLRWHDWGLLPQPRREGLGRGKGTASYYPKPAALQARALARLLRERRSLTEAGWGLWVWGFPLTEWARDLLVADVTEREKLARKAARSLKPGGPLARRIGRRGVLPEAPRMHAVAGRDMPRMLQMLNALQLGTLRAEDYTVDDWELLQGAALEEVWPDLATAPDLPSPQEVATGMAQLSAETSFAKMIPALRSLPAPQLEQYRNEAQWLGERFAPPDERAGVLISRDYFIRFFKTRHLNSEGQRHFPALMRALGQARSPASPMQRWRATVKAVTAPSMPSSP